jgi:hypothetical protein
LNTLEVVWADLPTVLSCLDSRCCDNNLMPWRQKRLGL